MAADDLAGRMRSAAVTLTGALGDRQRELAVRPFADTRSRRWLEYRPEYRPGACLGDFPNTARKAAHRLLATGLSEPAYAQAMGIVALEETLDRREGWVNGRHSGDYWVSVYGDPSDGGPWGWRFEGHHLSVSMTVAGGAVSPAPVFLGANPHRIAHAGHAVSRPLAPEEDLARDLLDALGPSGRAAAVIGGTAPRDIVSGPRGDVPAIGPAGVAGVAAAGLGPAARAALDALLALYLERLPPELAAAEHRRVAGAGDLRFAWAGPTTPGAGHYYRLQADDLLIEYDNTQDGANHAHTVLRRPRSDFGADILAEHYARAAH